jgi:glutamate-ammonia-ligase adenylyltransferase
VGGGRGQDPLRLGPARATAGGRRALSARLEDHPDFSAQLGPAAEEGPWREALAAAASGSPFLWSLARAHPVVVATLAAHGPDAVIARCGAALAAVAETGAFDGAMAAMRAARAEAALALGLADLAGVLDVDRAMTLQSAFADAAVRAALAVVWREAEAMGRLSGGPPDEGGLFVLALGKHGAHELNYSSDIDLAVFHEPSRLPVAGGREPQIAAVALTQRLVKLLSEVTRDGYVFRTDLRLRPDPGSTALTMPVAAALHYYETVGQNWERAAMIKARVVAGDAAVGEAFLAELQPFVWRKYFDYAAIADIHAMKRQIHAHKGHGEIAIEGHDIKLGRGGIREIEFFVQTQQLVFGGRRHRLRGASTLAMLDALAEEGWITGAAARDLTACYRLLRAVEHRLQMQHDEQTQRLPDDPAAFDRFAALSGATPAGLRRTLRRCFETVAGHYARLFEAGADLSGSTGSLVFTGVEDDPETLETLRALGFRDAPRTAETIRGWHFGRRSAITTPRAREALTELVPDLLSALGRSGDADAGLAALDALFGKATAGVELLVLLKSNPALLELFCAMLGGAPRLAGIVVQRPRTLDHLIDPDFAVRLPPAERRARILAVLSRPMPEEALLDLLRETVAGEQLALGARMLSGVIDPLEGGAGHTMIADAAVTAAFTAATRLLGERFGAVPGARAAVFGLGKFGGCEMTAASDLDLIVLYDAPEGASSLGPREVAATDYFARLTQKIVAILSAPTARGIAYPIDLRLRPSGSKGPLAVSLEAFRAYHQGEAETWEHMALTRARAIAGDASVIADAEETIAAILARRRDPAATRAEIAAMRRLIETEKRPSGPLDLKHAAGGLIDLEFLAQSFALLSGRPGGARPTGTHAMIAAAAEDGRIDADEARQLLAAWSDFTAFGQMHRVCHDADVAEDALDAGSRLRLAGALGLPDWATAMRRLVEARAYVREAFSRRVGAV